MKKIGYCLVVCLTMAASSFAGTMVQSSKEYKAPVEPTPCFGDHEFQADVFGAYGVTEAHQGAVMRDHGWGGGIGLNYFVARYVGFGIDGYGLDTKSDQFAFDRTRGEFRSGHLDVTSHDHAAWAATGSLIVRYPIDSMCLAPYLFVGGGAQWTRACFGSAHWGGGFEYRIVPQKVALFLDGRFTVLADKQDVPIHNPHFTLVRAGVRFVF